MRSRLLAFAALCSVLVFTLAAVGCGDRKKAQRAPSSHDGNGYTPAPAGASNPDAGTDTSSGGSGGGSGGAMPPFEASGASSKPVDTSGVTKFSSMIDASQVLDTLSPSDITSVCQRYRSYLDDEIPPAEAERAYCYYHDASEAKSVAECKGVVDDCRATTSFTAGPCPLEGLDADTDCAAIIDDFEACATEIAAVGSAFVAYYDCSLVDAAATTAPPQQLTATAAACGFLYATCPQLD